MRLNDATPADWDELRKKYPAMIKKYENLVESETETTHQPIRPFKLPADAKERKAIPVYSGVIKYFPRALSEVARVSLEGGIQHGQTPETLHWDRPKSGDELDAMMRHVLDEDWGQVAWRALANLEKYLEREEQN